MKHKLDFVTNSSSVSVVMWGAYITPEDIKENEVLMAKIKEVAEKEELNEEEMNEELITLAEGVIEDTDLITHYDYCGEGFYAGKSPFDIKEDETAREFKSGIEKNFKELGINKEVEQIIESWRDG